MTAPHEWAVAELAGFWFGGLCRSRRQHQRRLQQAVAHYRHCGDEHTAWLLCQRGYWEACTGRPATSWLGGIKARPVMRPLGVSQVQPSPTRSVRPNWQTWGPA